MFLPIMLVLPSTVLMQAICDQFSEETCPITEDSLLGFIHTDTAQQCQDKCREKEDCMFFTWYSTQCFLLYTCSFTEACRCCISGPGLEESENVDDCITGCSQTTTTTPTTTTTTMIATTSELV